VGLRGAAAEVVVEVREVGASLWGVTAKEKLLERAPELTEVQAEAMLRVLKAQDELEAYFDAEAKLSDEEIAASEDRWAEANAREAIREEPW
jgi:hypothetical protein